MAVEDSVDVALPLAYCENKQINKFQCNKTRWNKMNKWAMKQNEIKHFKHSKKRSDTSRHKTSHKLKCQTHHCRCKMK